MGQAGRQRRSKGLIVLPATLAALLLIACLAAFLWLWRTYSLSTAQDDSVPAFKPIHSEEPELNFDGIFSTLEAQDIAQQADDPKLLPPVLEGVDEITVDLIPLNEYSRPGVLLDGVSAVVVHYTACPGASAQQNRDYFASLAISGEDSVSSHFVIGLEGEIIQCIPLDEKSYCTSFRNHDTISIECCHPDETGAFTQETRDSLIWLLRYLTQGYGLGEDGVIRHYDVTGKLCPLYYVEHEDEWNQLKDQVFSSQR